MSLRPPEERNERHGDRAGGVLRAGPAGILAALGIAALLSWAVIAVAHADDLYMVNHVSGTRMALAEEATGGTLYPPLYDGRSYGGTRFMPVPIALHAGLAILTGDVLTSGKLLSYASVLALLALTYVLLRRRGCPVPLALALTGGLVATGTGLLAAAGIQADALPLALQLGAVALVERSVRPRSLVVAAALCALAFLAKLSALWAPVAIVAWLSLRHRSRVAWFAGALAIFLLVGTAVFWVWSDGRLASNVSALAFGGVSSPWEARRVVTMMATHVGVMSVVVPLAAAEAVVARRRGGLALSHVALAAAWFLTLAVLTDSGTDHNHLLDVLTLSVIGTGALWAVAVRSDGGLARVLLSVVVAWAVLATFAATVYDDAREAGSVLAGGSLPPDQDPARLSDLVDPVGSVLSEDPTIPVLLDQPVVVLDAWAARQIGIQHPAWIEALADRIKAHEFDRLVLLRDLDASEEWFTERHFGPVVYDAMRESYRLESRTLGFFIYVPST